jgi:transcriptional regulator with XRE-family HTH domain
MMIGHYEREISRPAADTQKRMGDALGVSGDYLIEGATANAAQAKFEDRELLPQFQEIE